MAEVGMPMEQYKKINKEAIDVIRVYGNNFGEDPLKAPAGIIGKYCAMHLKKVYDAKAQIDSYTTTTLQDFT